MRDIRQGNSRSNGNTALVLLLEGDIGRRLIDPDPKALHFSLDNPLINQGLIDIEDNEDQIARLGHRNDLSSTTLTILGTLDNTGQIEDLDLGSVVHHLSGDRGESCELVRGSCISQHVIAESVASAWTHLQSVDR